MNGERSAGTGDRDRDRDRDLNLNLSLNLNLNRGPCFEFRDAIQQARTAHSGYATFTEIREGGYIVRARATRRLLSQN